MKTNPEHKKITNDILGKYYKDKYENIYFYISKIGKYGPIATVLWPESSQRNHPIDYDNLDNWCDNMDYLVEISAKEYYKVLYDILNKIGLKVK